MEAKVIASELREKGFVAIEAGDFVIVTLLNRKVSKMEVDKALDELGHEETTTSIDAGVLIEL